MRLFGIIGKPLDHSPSPKWYNAVFKKLRLPDRYLPFQVERRHLKNLITCMKLCDVDGLNVTAPYKEMVVAHLDRLDRSAKICGAVNTIVRRKNRFIGYNTDGLGFLRSLKTLEKTSPRHQRVTILGAGGAARGIAAALAAAGASEIVLLNRHPARGRRAIAHLKKYFPKTQWECRELTKVACKKIFPRTEILIQTTSALLRLPLQHLPKKARVCDIITHPHQTPLLCAAKKRKLKTLDGRRMFAHQATLNLKLWRAKTEKSGYLLTLLTT